MLTSDQRAIIRTRYIARNQLDTLSLHPDLCRKVLNDYGCAVVEIEPTTETKQGIIEASWPHPSEERRRYLGTMLDHLTQQILAQTAQADAQYTADALALDQVLVEEQVHQLQSAVTELLEVAGWYTSFYHDVEATAPEYFENCGDLNACMWLFSQAQLIRSKYDPALA